MIATAQNSAPCQVFDANGLEWKYMRWVNTETGEGEQCVMEADGRKRVNATWDGVATQQVKLAAPVLLMPIKRADDGHFSMNNPAHCDECWAEADRRLARLEAEGKQCSTK